MKLISVLLLLTLTIPVPATAINQNNDNEDELSAQDRYMECRMITPADLRDNKAPRFDDYRVPTEWPTLHPKVDTKTTEIGRTFRTVLQNEISYGANFAGHYRLAIWGCGSSCSSFAVVNIKSGEVIVPDNLSSVSGNHLNTEELGDLFLHEGFNDGAWGYRYKKNSRLIVFVGTLDEDNNREGAYYYILENDELKPVHQTHVIKNCKR